MIAAGPARKEVPVVSAAASGRLARLRRGRRRRALLSRAAAGPVRGQSGAGPPSRNATPARAAPAFTASLDEALAGEPDLVIELLGGSDHPADVMLASLRRGAHVVTANKAAVARHYDALHACADAAAAALLIRRRSAAARRCWRRCERLRRARAWLRSRA